MREAYGVAAFRSRQNVLWFEQVLRRHGVPVSVISTPRNISMGCGLSLRFPLGSAQAVRRTIGVADVVQAAGCSRRYVEQHFRSQLNASVRDVILRTKLERVRSLLEESNLTIGEIAAQCGNMNESHLAVLFKKATGLSMSDYRRRNREPPDD